jgi:hypothetical protein
LWLLGINWLHNCDAEVCCFVPSIAQSRIQSSLLDRARAFLRRCGDAHVGGKEVNSYRHLDDSAYSGLVSVVPLGVRAGIPDIAATVDAGTVLQGYDDTLAAMVEDPDLLLLPPELWPELPRKPFMRLDSTYPLLVDNAVAAGLQELADEESLVHHQGKAMFGGGFAVAKNEIEDRWIAPLEFSNDIVDDSKLPIMQVPYLPQLAAILVTKPSRILVSKRDARHYFHMLRNGTRWRRYLGMPPV